VSERVRESERHRLSASAPVSERASGCRANDRRREGSGRLV